jgi:hypothetical protein
MKTYIKPNTEMHAIELQSMIANTTLNVDTTQKVISVSEIEAKDNTLPTTNSVWDEEE